MFLNKDQAILTLVKEARDRGQPVLVGTVSIEKSEKLSGLLRRNGIKHVVLNAKYHAQEAEIVAQAGRLGMVTIATNMAGRGTDILLGGNAEFMTRQQCLAEQVAERLPKGEERFVDDEEFVYFFHLDSFYRVPRKDYERIFDAFKQQTSAEHEQVVAPRLEEREPRGDARRIVEEIADEHHHPAPRDPPGKRRQHLPDMRVRAGGGPRERLGALTRGGVETGQLGDGGERHLLGGVGRRDQGDSGRGF